ncbi:MAG: hypothetical protein WCA85_25910 [Paraburkholderia sp.]|uniref:hypothetical protein n=1 Tax=Paraburkholderia sp. TaxID=1926495 RepID=UPI003C443501
MKNILRRLAKLLGPNSGYPVPSALAFVLLATLAAFFLIWALAWVTHFAAEFFLWLPWPKG